MLGLAEDRESLNIVELKTRGIGPRVVGVQAGARARMGWTSPCQF